MSVALKHKEADVLSPFFTHPFKLFYILIKFWLRITALIANSLMNTCFVPRFWEHPGFVVGAR